MSAASKTVFFGRRIRHMGRLAQIVNVFARHGMYSVLQTAGIKNWLTPEQVKTAEDLAEKGGTGEPNRLSEEQIAGLPQRFRQALEELGPAFVKLGQLLAAREDLLPDAYIQELQKLHSNVIALPYSTIEQVLNSELGESRLRQFEHIEQTPLAAGSIGQVHKARMHSGDIVVLKVQRPNISRQIDVDLSLMEELASLLEKFIPELRTFRPLMAVQELKRALLTELDFIREGGNTSKIAHQFSMTSFVQIPKVYWELTTTKVLTLSYIEGMSVSNKEPLINAGLDPILLVDRGFSVFLKMVFVHGYFHGDLHAGNLLALKDSRIGILDFGVVIRLSRSSREHLAGLLMALVEEDYEAMVSHFVDLSDPDPDFRLDAFQHEVANALAPFLGLKLRQMRSGHLLWDLAKVAARHGAPLPSELIVFLKTMASFEGIGNRLDPDFDMISACEKFAGEIVTQMYSKDYLLRQGMTIARDAAGLAKHAPYYIRRILKTFAEGHASIQVNSDDVTKLAQSVDVASARLAVSVLTASLIIGSSILAFSKSGDQNQSTSLFGVLGFTVAGLMALYVIWSIFRGRKL